MARHANGRIGRQQGPGAAVATVTRAAGSKRAVDVHRGLAHAATPMGSPQGAPGPADPAPGLALATLDRRRFLVVLGGAAALHALAPSLSLARRAAGTLPRLQPWTLPDLLPTNPIEAGRALVGAAVLAPSHWNAQPWRFEVDADELRVLLDPTRVLPLDDPDQRFAQMSIGAALENLLVAARAWGQQPAARYLPWGTAPRPGSSLVAAAVSWKPAERPRDRLLFLAVAAGTLVATIYLYGLVPRGFIPNQDTNQLQGSTEFAQDASFDSMVNLQQKVAAVINADPNVDGFMSRTAAGGGGGGQTGNSGMLMLRLKPRSERQLSPEQVIEELRPKLNSIP